MNSLRRFSLSRILLTATLALVLLCGLGLASWQLYLWVEHSALQELEQRVDADIKRYANTLSNEIDKYQSLPTILATNPQLEALISTDDEALRSRLIETVNRYFEQINAISGASDIYLLDQSGTTIAASNWYQSSTFIGRNFSYRPYYTDAIQGVPGRYFALGTTSNKRGYYFSYPIYTQTAISGVVVVKIDLDDIEDQWTDPILDLLVTDDDGVIFISTKPEWKFHSISNLTMDDLERIHESRRYSGHPLLSLGLKEQQYLNTQASLSLFEDPQSKDTIRFMKVDYPMPKEGLHVVGLAKLSEVNRRVREQMLIFAGGLILTLLLIAVVIQKRRIAEERTRFRQQQTTVLEANEARVSAILNNAQAGLLTLDQFGVIESANPIAGSLLGYQPEDLVGRKFSSLICESARAKIDQSASLQQSLFFETQAFNRAGERFPIEVSIGELSMAGEPKRLLTLHDIRERKKYEQHLQQSRDELEARVKERTQDLTRINEQLTTEIEHHQQTQDELTQAAKLAVLGQLSAGINHELNQPLTAIRSYAENSQRFLEQGDTETSQKNMAEIAQLTERMSKIIAPLKVFARKSQGQPEPVNLKLIQDGAMAILYPQIDAKQVDIIWPENLVAIEVIGDVVRLEQVVVNVLNNAIDAMENSAVKQITITAEEHDEQVTLAFHDSGPGIPDAELSKVFEPFFTTKSLKQQGLGLGLSISQRIVDGLGGKMTVANHPSGGAVFSLILRKATAQ